jgi:hypothetical protein
MSVESILISLTHTLQNITDIIKTKLKYDVCQFGNCDYTLISQQTTFCTLHKCFNKECQYQRNNTNKYNLYCKYHICDMKKCVLPSDKKTFCIIHKCRVTRCANINQTFGPFCAYHSKKEYKSRGCNCGY